MTYPIVGLIQANYLLSPIISDGFCDRGGAVRI